jgi:superfamily I DNA/RNA helicase
VVDENRLGPEAPRDLIIDSSDLPTLARALHLAWGSSVTAPGKEGIKALTSVLRPPVDLSRSGLVGAMRKEQDELIRLTEQQERLLDFIGGHRRVAVSGTAGSGKTLVAMEATRRLARQGFRVLYTCFTKALAAWVRESLEADLGPLMEKVAVDNYHDLAARYLVASGGSMPEGLDSTALNIFFQDELPQLFLESLDAGGARFDAIVVDEGQDFADIWWVTLESLLADQANGIFFVFYDDNQRIFDQEGAYPIPPPHHRLTSNCRTTRAIHRAAAAYIGGPIAPACDGPEGRPPLEVETIAGQPVDALRTVLHELVSVEGVPLHEIVVLTPRSQRTSDLREGAKLGNATLTWGDAGRNQVRCRSIQAFKGLEAPVVILAEPDRAHVGRTNALLHVALTRAKHHVIVLGKLPPVTT